MSEEEVREQIRQNWIDVKDQLSASWRTVSDQLFQKGAIECEDLQAIRAISLDNEKINHILMRVFGLKKCKQFISILEENGFSDLCRKIRDTEAVRQTLTIDRGNTYVIPDSSGAGQNNAINEGFESLKKEFKEGQEMMQEKMQLFFNEKFEELKSEYGSSFASLAVKYEELKKSYEQSRDRINELTNLSKKKTLENTNLTNQIEIMQSEIEKLKEQTWTMKVDEHNKEKLQTQVEELERENKEKGKELEKLKTEIDLLNEGMKEKEKELRKTKNEFQTLRKESIETSGPRAEKIAEKAKAIEGSIDTLMRRSEECSNTSTGNVAASGHKLSTSYTLHGRRIPRK